MLVDLYETMAAGVGLESSAPAAIDNLPRTAAAALVSVQTHGKVHMLTVPTSARARAWLECVADAACSATAQRMSRDVVAVPCVLQAQAERPFFNSRGEYPVAALDASLPGLGNPACLYLVVPVHADSKSLWELEQARVWTVVSNLPASSSPRAVVLITVHSASLPDAAQLSQLLGIPELLSMGAVTATVQLAVPADCAEHAAVQKIQHGLRAVYARAQQQFVWRSMPQASLLSSLLAPAAGACHASARAGPVQATTAVKVSLQRACDSLHIANGALGRAISGIDLARVPSELQASRDVFSSANNMFHMWWQACCLRTNEFPESICAHFIHVMQLSKSGHGQVDWWFWACALLQHALSSSQWTDTLPVNDALLAEVASVVTSAASQPVASVPPPAPSSSAERFERVPEQPWPALGTKRARSGAAMKDLLSQLAALRKSARAEVSAVSGTHT